MWPYAETGLGGRIFLSAFTTEEKEKLKMHYTSHCPNRSPESIYYSFLMCEVKCSDELKEAERQAMHSASIATNAIIQLYKKVSQAQELNRKLLMVSIAHDNSRVMVFGHFARITNDRVTFFRHRYATPPSAPCVRYSRYARYPGRGELTRLRWEFVNMS